MSFCKDGLLFLWPRTTADGTKDTLLASRAKTARKAKVRTDDRPQLCLNSV